MRIDDRIFKIISSGTTDGNKYYLPDEKLDRKTYVAVNKVLDLLKGKWNRKEKAHLFPDNVDDLLADVIATGEIVDQKKEYQFFPTPPELAERLVELAEIKTGMSVLEPSAGDGAIADKVPSNINVEVCEIMAGNCGVLSGKGYLIVATDFLNYSVRKYDRIVANPPFSKQQDIDHVTHMFELLKEGGRLVSIVSESPFFRESKKSVAFRKLVEDHGESIELDAGAFKSSGTMVKTRIVILNK